VGSGFRFTAMRGPHPSADGMTQPLDVAARRFAGLTDTSSPLGTELLNDPRTIGARRTRLVGWSVQMAAWQVAAW
jgi:hypothetical protein